jgi:hypothetical protein
MRKQTVRLAGDTQRAYAKRLIDNAPLGHVMLLGEETRTDAQNRLMWPLIADLQAQVPEHAKFSADDTKLRFLHALGQELRFLPELEGAGVFPVGQRSSTLTKSQFTALVELIFMEGARHGVRWSQRSVNSRDEVMAA